MIKQYAIKLLFILVSSFIVSGCVSTNKMLMSEVDRDKAFEEYIKIENLESLERVSMFRFHGFSTLTDQTLIITSSVNRSYLVTLQSSCINLRYANRISVNRAGTSLVAKFDSISAYTTATHGERCYIKSIYKINQDQKLAIQNIGREKSLEAKKEQSEKA